MGINDFVFTVISVPLQIVKSLHKRADSLREPSTSVLYALRESCSHHERVQRTHLFTTEQHDDGTKATYSKKKKEQTQGVLTLQKEIAEYQIGKNVQE